MQLVWHLLLKTAKLFDMFKALYLWNNKLINRDNHINDFRKIKKKSPASVSLYNSSQITKILICLRCGKLTAKKVRHA